MGRQPLKLDERRGPARRRLLPGRWFRRSEGMRPHRGHSGLWPDLPGRAVHNPRFRTTRQHPRGARVPDHGKDHGQLFGWWRRSRIASGAVALAGILSFSGLTGCQPARPSPEALFESVYTEYVHGSLEAAYTHAEQARKE